MARAADGSGDLAAVADAVVSHPARPGGGVHRVVPDARVDVAWTPELGLVALGPVAGPHLLPVGGPGVRVQLRVGRGALAAPPGLLAEGGPVPPAWGDAGLRLADGLAAARTGTERERLLGDAVRERGRDLAVDRLVLAAARRLARPGGDPGDPGDARLAAVSDALGIGERQLRRRFAAALGCGPRAFVRLVRLRRFLDLLVADPPPGAVRPGLAEAAARAGYCDQAHATRDCTDLTGLPPAALLRESGRAAPAPVGASGGGGRTAG